MIKAKDGLMVISKAQAVAVAKALADKPMNRDEWRHLKEFLKMMCVEDEPNIECIEWWEVKNVCAIFCDI